MRPELRQDRFGTDFEVWFLSRFWSPISDPDSSPILSWILSVILGRNSKPILPPYASPISGPKPSPIFSPILSQFLSRNRSMVLSPVQSLDVGGVLCLDLGPIWAPFSGPFPGPILMRLSPGPVKIRLRSLGKAT